MMHVIFLDIDGVLNSFEAVKSGECPVTGGLWDVSPTMLARFKKLLEDTGAQVVLSSTWRLQWQTQERLEGHGLYFCGSTPYLYSEANSGVLLAPGRAAEIYGFLESTPMDIDDYVILDDSADAEIPGHFYKTDINIGLTDAICDAIRQRWAR